MYFLWLGYKLLMEVDCAFLAYGASAWRDLSACGGRRPHCPLEGHFSE